MDNICRLSKLNTILHSGLEIDSNNIDSIREFFNVLGPLSNAEYATAAGVPRHAISKWKKLAGINKPRKILCRSRRNRTPWYPINNKVDWDNKEWFYKMRQYGVNNISKLLGVSNNLILSRFRKYNILPSGCKPLHPCDNYAWLYYHYVELSINITKCANIAGVSGSSIANWLNKYNISK